MKSDSISIMLLFVTFFSFAGWYMAETDNQILAQENSQLKAQTIHHE
ncbi:hypothetical protein QR674_05380 [Acinetobacter chinensis]|uniref:Uncharacterized protein n=1 Tax=Acinetobacter chinensis TaxID=2004650 RepID=A0ABU3WDD1_9GAMM|nr:MULTISPECIES: hypothetical protein [Acinetobacter]MDV2468410.1 hypothetical protein [Acinetobacter chinensis]